MMGADMGGEQLIVSARGDTTDELLRLAMDVSPRPPRRELDMLLSSGERISCGAAGHGHRALPPQV
jgi:aspartokinase